MERVFRSFHGIAGRLVIAFGFVLVLMLGQTIFAVSEVNQLERNLSEINDVNSRLQRFAINFRGSVHDRAIAIRDVVLIDAASGRQAAIADIETLAAAYAQNEVAMAALGAEVGLNAEARAILDDIAAIQTRTNPLVDEIIRLVDSGQDQAAHRLLTDEVSGLFTDWLAAINRFIDLKEDLNRTIGDEVTASVKGFERLALIALAIAAGLALAAGVIVSRSITRPISQLVAVMRKLTGGDYEVAVDGESRRDEIGEMSRAVSVFRDNGKDRIRLEAEQEQEQARALERQGTVDRLIASFRTDASDLLGAVSGTMDQMAGAANELTRIATKTETQARNAASASQDASQNVRTVSQSSRELSHSIEEIGRQVAKTSEVAHAATVEAQSTNHRVEQLNAAAARIGDVIGLISDIADQTNLLALNATIEAARAGEAGKGFAVVAAEVKDLASQTAKATSEISEQISSIQAETDGVVGAIRGISETIEQVNAFASAIASAVQEQSAATSEIGRSVAEAATGTEQAVTHVSDVTGSVTETRTVATRVSDAAADVTIRTGRLREAVDRFLGDVSAA